VGGDNNGSGGYNNEDNDNKDLVLWDENNHNFYMK
jgi:hypothetical protein